MAYLSCAALQPLMEDINFFRKSFLSGMGLISLDCSMFSCLQRVFHLPIYVEALCLICLWSMNNIVKKPATQSISQEIWSRTESTFQQDNIILCV